jgi:ACR3 family arsenite transporter
LQYLGIPLLAGIVTRYSVWALTSKRFLEDRFLPLFGPLALVGLLYTVFVLFAYQGNNIIHNIGPVFRTAVPLLIYFALMWTSAFALIYFLSKWRAHDFDYETAAVQSFTAGSNNFVGLTHFQWIKLISVKELAIAIAIASYGVGSKQALAATIGPLIEVPVLLALTYVALWLKRRLDWGKTGSEDNVVQFKKTRA